MGELHLIVAYLQSLTSSDEDFCKKQKLLAVSLFRCGAPSIPRRHPSADFYPLPRASESCLEGEEVCAVVVGRVVVILLSPFLSLAGFLIVVLALSGPPRRLIEPVLHPRCCPCPSLHSCRGLGLGCPVVQGSVMPGPRCWLVPSFDLCLLCAAAFIDNESCPTPLPLVPSKSSPSLFATNSNFVLSTATSPSPSSSSPSSSQSSLSLSLLVHSPPSWSSFGRHRHHHRQINPQKFNK